MKKVEKVKKGRIIVQTILGIISLFLILITVLLVIWLIGTSKESGQTNAEYIGSQTCAQCHSLEFETWQNSSHAKAFQAVSSGSDPILPHWEGTLSFSEGNIPEVYIRLEKAMDGTPLAILIDSHNPSIEKKYPVTRVSGGHGWKQRFYTLIDGEYYALPMDWNESIDNWTPFTLHMWWKKDGSLKRKPPTLISWGAMCAGCHETGIVTTIGIKGFEKQDSREEFIGCEKCHGPGESHALSPSRENIINPASLSFERELESCGQCHSYGNSVPVGLSIYPMKVFGGEMYRTGEVLDDYRKLKPILWEGTVYSKKHRQQFVDHKISGHYDAELSCTACHSPHGSELDNDLKAPLENGLLCLSCHVQDVRFESSEAITMHTKHDIPDMNCTSCHQQDATYSAAMGDGTSHHFQIVSPRVSLDMYELFKDEEPVPDLWSDGIVGHNSLATYLKHEIIPNSCNECHVEWKGSQEAFEAGVEAYDKKFQ